MSARRLLGMWIGACLLGSVVAAAHQQPEAGEDVAADAGTSGRREATTTTSTTSPTTTVVTTTAPAVPSTVVTQPPAPPDTAAAPARDAPEPAPTEPPQDPGTVGGAASVSGDGIWVIAADGSRLQRVADRCNSAAVRWMDGGTALAVGDGMRGVDVHHLDGRHQRIDIPMADHEWDVSPTGRYVVASAYEGDQITTSVWGLDGSRVVVATGPATTGLFAPDGQSIYLFRWDAYRVVSLSGVVLRDWQPTTFTPAMAFAHFSPDGRRILGHADGMRPAVLDLDTGTTTTMPELSPGHVNRWFDDDTIVAGLPGTPSVAPRLVLRDWRTGATTELTGNASWPAAQFGSGLVAFTSYRSDPAPIDLVQADGSGRHTLVAPEPGWYAHTLRWSPDQQLFAFATCGLRLVGGG